MTMTAGLIEDLRQQLAAAEAENERLCRVYAGICVTIVQAGIPVFGTAEEGVQKLAAEHDRAVELLRAAVCPNEAADNRRLPCAWCKERSAILATAAEGK